MPPNDYLRAREDASRSKDKFFCATVDGAPYFPNFVVGSAIEERDASIRKVVEHLTFQTARGTDGDESPSSSAPSFPASLDSSSWTVKPVTGGNTNQLFCVSGLSNNGATESSGLRFEYPNESVLVRLFGADGMIDRDEETSTYASLADQKLALRYYGRFGNGRIEEMLVGWTTLTEDDLMGKASGDATEGSSPTSLLPPSNLNESIARELARLHATYELPEHLLVKENDEKALPSLPEPTLWTQLYPWLERSLKAEFRTERDTLRANHELDPPLSSLKTELDWLRSEVIGEGETVSETTRNPGIGFCHNDLLASNIMMLTNRRRPSSNGDSSSATGDRLVLEGLRFIDFEYGGINYYAYDIANHFNEYAGGTAVEDNSTPDYDRCPDDERKRAFLEAYADEYNKHCSSSNNNNTITAEELGDRVDGFSLANHLVWGLWGVLQAATEGCEDGLDYLHYAKCRFDRYRHDAEAMFPGARTAAGSGAPGIGAS